MSESLTIALFASLVAMFGWGITDIFSKKAVDALGERVSTMYFFIVNFFLAFPMLVYDTSLPEMSIGLLVKLMLFAVADFVAFVLLFKALAMGKASVVVPITAGWAVLASVVSFLFFNESMSLGKAVLVTLAVAGIVFVSTNFRELRDGWQSGDLSKGVPQGLGIFIIYGIYVPLWGQIVKEDGWVWITIIERFMMVMIMSSYSIYYERSKVLPTKAMKYGLIMIFLGGLLQGIGANAFNIGLAKSEDTAVVAAISSGYPAVLAIASYIFLKERLAFNQYLGIVMIVAAICMIGLV